MSTASPSRFSPSGSEGTRASCGSGVSRKPPTAHIISSVGYLYRVFRATEEENRRAILADARAAARCAAARPRARTTASSRCGWRRGSARASVHGVELLEEHAEIARGRGIDVCSADLDDGLPFEDGVVRRRPRQPGDRARAPHRHLPARDPARARARTASRASRPTTSRAGTTSSRSRSAPADADARERRDDRRQPAEPARRPPRTRDLGRTHLRLFTARALTELCERHGLERVSLDERGLLPAAAAGSAGWPRASTRLHGAFLIGLFRPRTTRA